MKSVGSLIFYAFHKWKPHTVESDAIRLSFGCLLSGNINLSTKQHLRKTCWVLLLLVGNPSHPWSLRTLAFSLGNKRLDCTNRNPYSISSPWARRVPSVLGQWAPAIRAYPVLSSTNTVTSLCWAVISILLCSSGPLFWCFSVLWPEARQHCFTSWTPSPSCSLGISERGHSVLVYSAKQTDISLNPTSHLLQILQKLAPELKFTGSLISLMGQKKSGYDPPDSEVWIRTSVARIYL